MSVGKSLRFSALAAPVLAVAASFAPWPAMAAAANGEFARLKAPSPFIDASEPTAAPAGYLEMCERSASPFCENDRTNNVGLPGNFEIVSRDLLANAPATGGISANPFANSRTIARDTGDNTPKTSHADMSFCLGAPACLDASSGIDLALQGSTDRSDVSRAGCSKPVKASFMPRLDSRSALPTQGGFAFARASMRPDPSHARATGVSQPRLGCRLPTTGEGRAVFGLSLSFFDLDIGDLTQTARQPLVLAGIDGVRSAVPAPAAARPVDQALSFTAWRKLIKAENAFVNTRTHQVTDRARFGADERWERSYTGSNASGDCEDLAIEKRIRLIEAGFPADRLFFATVYRPDVGLHAVLIARMDKGDYVLDSLSPFIERWDKVPYAWVSVQDATRKDRWFSVESPRRLARFKPEAYRIVVSS